MPIASVPQGKEKCSVAGRSRQCFPLARGVSTSRTRQWRLLSLDVPPDHTCRTCWIRNPVGYVVKENILFVNEPVACSSLEPAPLRPIHLLIGPTLRKQALLESGPMVLAGWRLQRKVRFRQRQSASRIRSRSQCRSLPGKRLQCLGSRSRSCWGQMALRSSQPARACRRQHSSSQAGCTQDVSQRLTW